MRQLRAPYALGAVLTVAYAVSFQLVPLASREIVGRIDEGRPFSEVTDAALIMVAVTVVFALLRMSSRYVLARTSREVEFRLRNDLFAHLQRLPQSYFAGQRTGDLMSRAVNDINNVRMLLGVGLQNMLQTPILFLGALTVMCWVHWQLALLFLLPYPFFILIARFFGRRIHAASLATQEQLGEVSTAVQENAAGVFVVRSYAMEDRERERFGRENDELYRRQIRLAFTDGALDFVIHPLPTLGQIIVLFAGAQLLTGEPIARKDLWLFLMYTFQLFFPTFMMGWVLNIAQRGLVGLRRLGEILDTEPTIADRPDVIARDAVDGEVEFSHLSFAYPGRGRTPALHDVSFRAETGQTVGIVGPVGSGKSTLLGAIPRLLEIPDGSVRIDGACVNRLPLALLRSSIAMVPQDSFLFSTTIAENIRFGAPDANESQVREAARRAHVIEDIEDFPHGFETIVGERGVTLSGGQRQRIALARALLLRPAILILDDALSSVDSATEEAILKDLRGARAGRTCFIVAHRVTAVRDADFILVLDEGRLVETGRHQDLARRSGAYARIHAQQQLEAEIEEAL